MDDPDTQNASIKRIAAALVAIVALSGGAWWYFTQRSSATAPAPAPIPEVTPVSAPALDPASTTAIQHPLTPEPGATPADGLPDAATGNARLIAAASTLLGDATAEEWLITDGFVRRLVVTADNLPRNSHIERQRPLRAPQTPFVAERETIDASAGTERISLSQQNYTRYDVLVGVLARTDMQQVAGAYRRLYPVLQAEYEELGYPGQYFNDRVVEVIDHLLETPELQGPVLLIQPKVLYQYADATLEARSAGQKLLLRMGATLARTIKKKLRELRVMIANPKTASTQDYRSFHVAQ